MVVTIHTPVGLAGPSEPDDVFVSLAPSKALDTDSPLMVLTGLGCDHTKLVESCLQWSCDRGLQYTISGLILDSVQRRLLTDMAQQSAFEVCGRSYSVAWSDDSKMRAANSLNCELVLNCVDQTNAEHCMWAISDHGRKRMKPLARLSDPELVYGYDGIAALCDHPTTWEMLTHMFATGWDWQVVARKKPEPFMAGNAKLMYSSKQSKTISQSYLQALMHVREGEVIEHCRYPGAVAVMVRLFTLFCCLPDAQHMASITSLTSGFVVTWSNASLPASAFQRLLMAVAHLVAFGH
jgi:hypothetical protein